MADMKPGERMFQQQSALNGADGQTAAAAATSAPAGDHVGQPGAASPGDADPPLETQATVPPATYPNAPSLDGLGVVPVADALNSTILDLHVDLETAADRLGPIHTTHAITTLGETAGLGHIGETNLVTDVIGTPVGLLSADTTHISNLPSDVSHVVSALEAVPQSLVTDLQNGIVSGPDPLGAVSPIVHVPNDVVTNVQPLVDGLLAPILPHTTGGLDGLVSAVGLTSDLSSQNLVRDVLLTPVSVLRGDPAYRTDHLPQDVSDAVHGVQGLVEGVVTDLGHGGDLGGILGGGGGPLGGLLGGEGGDLLGGLGGGGEGGHNLITAAAGSDPAGGLLVNLLTPQGDSSHAVDVNAIHAPQAAPTVAHAEILPDLPLASGGIADALSGILDNGPAHAIPVAAPAPTMPAGLEFDHVATTLVPTLSELLPQQHHALA